MGYIIQEQTEILNLKSRFPKLSEFVFVVSEEGSTEMCVVEFQEKHMCIQRECSERP